MTVISVTIAALWLLMMGSALVWSIAVARVQRGLSIIPLADVPRASWPWTAVLAAAAWVAVLTFGRISNDLHGDISLPNARTVVANLATSVLIWLSVMLPLLKGHSHPWSAFGFSLEHCPQQLGYGGGAYVAAFLPTFVLMQALAPWRSENTQHGFLRLLAESPDWWLVLAMFFTVAIVAPLSEELLFRVALQGWLSERLGATLAIPAVAVLFAAIHGWRDGLALVPLALILGYLFERRRSYLAVVTTHGLFNSVMFGLTWLAERA